MKQGEAIGAAVFGGLCAGVALMWFLYGTPASITGPEAWPLAFSALIGGLGAALIVGALFRIRQQEPGWLLAVLGVFADIVAVAVAGFAFNVALDANQLARDALEDQQIGTAWQLIGNRATGSTGKQYALGVLLKPAGADLRNIELGCDRAMGDNMGGIDPTTLCDGSVDLSGLTVVPVGEGQQSRTISLSNFEGAQFDDANLADIMVLGSNLREADLSLATMNHVVFSHVSFFEARIDATWSRANFHNVDFTGVDLFRVNFGADARFSGAINVSGATFCHDEECVEGLSDKFWTIGWYWSDNPPKAALADDEDLSAQLRLLTACKYHDGSRVRVVRPNTCAPNP